MIASNPKLKGIYGVYSYDGPAGAVAVKSKGDTGKIWVVADDNEPGTIKGLKNGTVVPRRSSSSRTCRATSAPI